MSNDHAKLPFSLDRMRDAGLVVQIADALRHAIATGYYPPGELLPPIRELSAQLGVSKGMAERAIAILRNEGRISPRPHIGSVVCALDRPPMRGHVVIVVSPGPANPFQNVVHACLRDALTSAGYLATSVTVPETASRRYDDFSLLDTVLRQKTDFVVQLHNVEGVARWLSRRGIPFARRSSKPCHLENCVGTVRLDFGMAVPAFVRRCREAGVRSVLQVKSANVLDVTGAMNAAGIAVETWRGPHSPKRDMGFDIAAWALEAFAGLLAERGRAWLPDLLFFADDHLATGAFLALAAAGVRIPEDVRVATWANRGYGPLFSKPLSRMEMDNVAFGAKLAECVLEYLRAGAFPKGVVCGPQWIDGETM